MAESTRVIIIGGGVTGVAAAYELARAGADVTLFERGSLASMGSGRTLAGVRQSGRHPDELPLAMAAVERWQTLGRELDADLEYRQCGNLRLAEDEQDAEALRCLVSEHSDEGLEIEFLSDNRSVQEVAPAIAEHVVGAAYCPTDGHANPIATVHAYAEAAHRHSASFLEQTAVHQIVTEGGRVTGVATDQGLFQADRVILATGIDTPRLLAPLGLDLPITLAIVPVVQTAPTDPVLEPVLGTAKAHFAARHQVDGRLRFSSGGHRLELRPDDISDVSMQPTAAMITETLSRAVDLIPALATIPIQTIWGGLIDLTPDGLPVLDRIQEVDGLIVVAGFCGHGFCLGPVSGEVIRDLVIDDHTCYPIEPFQFNRFIAQAGTSRPELLG